MSPASPRRLLLVLAASLGVHALVWILLELNARETTRRTPPAPPAPVTFEFVEVDPPAPPPRPTPPRPSKPSQLPPPRLPVPLPASPPAAPPPAPVVPRAEVPLAEDAPRASSLRLTPPSLVPVSTLPLGGQVSAEPPDTTVPGGLPVQSAQQIVDTLAMEGLGKGKVERGLVHPYFTQLGKSLLKTWDAERAVSSQGLKGFLEQAQENNQAWNNVWRDRAAAYGASGSPLELDASLKAKRRPPGLNPREDSRRLMRQQMREEFLSTRRAILRVVQDAQGRLIEVTLVSPSNNAQVDREAVKDVRAAAEQLPPPPPEALQNRRTLTSLWQFELIISISPPVPTLSFEFDEALQFVDMRMPLDRRIYKRVRLLSVQ